MKKLKDTVLFIVITSFLLTGCKEEPNSIDPTLELISPTDGAVYDSDESIPFKAQIDDDERLLNYVVTVRTEEEYNSGKSAFVLAPFSYARTFGINGSSELVERAIPLELDIRRDIYVLEAYSTDYWGNVSGRHKAVFEIRNANDLEAPDLDITSLQEGNANYFPAGSNFQLEGSAEDNEELGLLEVRFIKVSGNETVSEEEFGLDNNFSKIDQQVTMPEEKANYLLELVLRDNVNNSVFKEFSVIAN